MSHMNKHIEINEEVFVGVTEWEERDDLKDLKNLKAKL
jgi:hypothetical protein